MLLIGTAGHIDHGKSALVKALTGIHPSRLPEEKEREMTIDLGYAWMKHPDGTVLGFIDVPGHEKLIKNMVAGATGMGVALLVVDAREGPRAQTYEHLNILTLLGVGHIIPVLTKTTLASGEQREAALRSMEEMLKAAGRNRSRHSSQAKAESGMVYQVDSLSGQGIDALKLEIFTMMSNRSSRDGLPLYLPIDRSFQLKGIGTVVTGTLFNGRLRVNQEVTVSSLKDPVRVRSLHSHNTSVEEITSGRRVGVQLPGVHHSDIRRGDIILDPEHSHFTTRVNATVEVLGDSPVDLKHNQTFLVHTGCMETVCRMWLIGDDPVREVRKLGPGETGLVQLLMERGSWFYFGQRFLLRSTTPLLTIAGGKVLDCVPDKPRRVTSEEKYSYTQGNSAAAALAYIKHSSLLFHRVEHLSQKFLCNRNHLLKLLEEDGGFIHDAKDGLWSNARSTACLSALVETGKNLTQLISGEPHLFQTGITLKELSDRLKLPELLLHRFLEKNLRDPAQASVYGNGGQLQLKQGRLFLEGGGASLPPDLEAIRKAVVSRMEREGLQTTLYSPLKEGYKHQLGSFHKVLKFLKDTGEVVEISREYSLLHSHYRKVLSGLAQLAREPFTISQLGKVLGISRKYTVPLAEYLDKQGITKRDGNVRHLLALPRE